MPSLSDRSQQHARLPVNAASLFLFHSHQTDNIAATSYELPLIFFSWTHQMAVGPEREQHVTHPALGPGRVFVWVTWLAQSPVSTKINPAVFIKSIRVRECLRQCVSLPSAAVTPAHSAQAVQLWPTKSSRLGTRRSRAAITFTARSRTAIITARQAPYVIFRALDRIGTSCVRVLGTPTHTAGWSGTSLNYCVICIFWRL